MPALPLKMPEESPWVTLVVSLAVIGMLAVFYSVVSSAVQASELRKKTMAHQSAAVMHCNALPGWANTRNCLKELGVKVATEEPTMFASQ